MSDDYSEILEQLAKDIAETAKLSLADVRATLVNSAPLVLQWTAEAKAAEDAGNLALAKKKRQSVKNVKNSIALDVAIRSVEQTDRIERMVLSLFDKLLTTIA